MIGERDAQANEWWDELYAAVLGAGEWSEVRGKRMLEVNDVQYQCWPHQHLDTRAARGLNLDYVRREFLWFLRGDRYDTRMRRYAKLWEACVQRDGGINSNYGQYLFGRGWSSMRPFYAAMQRLREDRATRRAWIPIFQSWHQGEDLHGDYPCTTGMGFRFAGDELEMVVHMRSQDLWWGAANDEPVCYMIQLLAVAYLSFWMEGVRPGRVVHKVDNLHFYDRHVPKAVLALGSCDTSPDVETATETLSGGFRFMDLTLTVDSVLHEDLSPAMTWVLDIPGDYGAQDMLVGVYPSIVGRQ